MKIKPKRIIIDVDSETHYQVKMKATKENKTIREIFQSFIDKYLKTK